jgi:hypothetical protein
MPGKSVTLGRCIACLGLILAFILPLGCGVDSDTLATPTRYNDPTLASEEIKLFLNPDFEIVAGPGLV